jgi:hypothetical protein
MYGSCTLPRLAPKEIWSLAHPADLRKESISTVHKFQNMPLHIGKIDHFDVIQPELFRVVFLITDEQDIYRAIHRMYGMHAL